MSTCEMCLCYCDQLEESSHRIVSTQLLDSNVSDNEVITGIRVVKLVKVIYLQIQVGKLISGQKIDQKSVRWVPINPVRHLDYNQDGEDYAVIRRNTPFDLDIWTLNGDFIVTGKSF